MVPRPPAAYDVPVCRRGGQNPMLNVLAGLREGGQRVRRARAPDLDAQQRTFADNLYQEVSNTLRAQALARAPRNFVTLECLANEDLYAKPDTRKRFYLWEARCTTDIQVRYGHLARLNHPHLVDLFVRMDRIRFPYNPADAHHDHSLSPSSIAPRLLYDDGTIHVLPRWSTASRSNIAMVPLRGARDLEVADDAVLQLEERVVPVRGDRDPAVHVDEWLALRAQLRGGLGIQRTDFAHVVGSPGAAARPRGVQMNGAPFRMYSIKTGVDYVGSKYEGPGGGGKHRLEANCNMAMDRSDVMLQAGNRDATFGIQGELLTITAPLDGVPVIRDGFQVRDLSCLRPRLDYVPGHALPFAREHFQQGDGPEAQMGFWRRSFAIPLGRAKARMMLNYGLVHTSANAQNFVLGFAGRRLEHFVIRDVGDTSWHDTYLRDVLRGGSLHRAYTCMRAESQHPTQQHTLRVTGGGDYPPPDIVRLAAVSVLTHRWGDNMGWSYELQRRFTTGVYDGFRTYLNEVFRLGLDYPSPVGVAFRNRLGDGRILTELGFECRYPYFPFNPVSQGQYRQRIGELQAASPRDLLQQAAWVRRRGRELLAARPGETRLKAVLNAEEALLCCAVDNLLRDANHGRLSAAVEQCHRGSWPAIIP